MKGSLPVWFKRKIPPPLVTQKIRGLLDRLSLHTICESAQCPNSGECSCQGTATFLILGDICTRNCTFCAVRKGIPGPTDENESQHLLEAVEKLGLTYVVITSVTRDDLDDGGASCFARVINLLHENRNGIAVEVLVPDFLGSTKALKKVVEASPEIINHNVETIPRLYSQVRPKADYNRSVGLLSTVKKLNPKIVTKSGLMLGLGEINIEVIDVMRDLREVGCDLLTIGQYLQPSSNHRPVFRFISPEEFSEYAQIGLDMGFAGVASAPLVRSSYRAAEQFSKVSGSCKLMM